MTARDRMVLSVVVAVPALAAFWFLLLSPKRDEAKSLDGQIGTTQSQLSSAQASIAQSQVAARSYPSSYATLARLGKAVPTDPQVPSLIYELNSAAQSQTVASGSQGCRSPRAWPSKASRRRARRTRARLPPGSIRRAGACRRPAAHAVHVHL